MNSTANPVKGKEKYEVELADLHTTGCGHCKNKIECTKECKHKSFCKIHVIRTKEGIARMRRLCKNDKLLVRGTECAAEYNLIAAHTVEVPAKEQRR